MQTQNLIGSHWRGADTRRSVPVIDPATDEVIAEVPAGGAAETRTAIDAAAAALDDWRARRDGERSALLRRLNEYLEVKYVSWGQITS